MIPLTTYTGRIEADGEITVPGIRHASSDPEVNHLVEQRERAIRDGGIVYLRLRPKKEREAVRRGMFGYRFSPRGCCAFEAEAADVTDETGRQRGIKGKAKKGPIDFPFKEGIDRSTDPARMVLLSTIRVGEDPSPVTTPEALWLLSHKRWGLIVEECTADGEAVVCPKWRPPTEPRLPSGAGGDETMTLHARGGARRVRV